MAQTVVITGTNRGLGAEFVKRLEARGDRVIPLARPAIDVRDLHHIAARARDAGPVDVLINNAGRQYRASGLEQLDFNELRDVYDVNALGPLRVLRAFLDNLRAGQRRLVVQITSRMGCFGEYDGPSMPGYRASKAALNMYHRCVADELGPEGFTCVALHPGWVRTDIGGAEATLGVEESVDALMPLIDGFTPDDNGAILDWEGNVLPW
ncbi:MAG: SDR family oxidoreductase [Planctomycetota bacterium]|jgi:NAD(P)-dependent dehydrogenase (short-subunit alcohol dehydrogenase family)